MTDPVAATDRAALISAFLDHAGWGRAARQPLAGDASMRQYLRLRAAEGATAVLMNAPPDRGEDVRPFTAIARHLAGLGFSAPHILADDPAAGLLLLEDLGDCVFARVVEAEPSRATTLYSAATDLLVALQAAAAPPGLPAYDAATMGDLAALALDWYLPGVTGSPAAEAATRAGFAARVAALCDSLAPAAPSIALRDFHAENLIWLPDRAGHARVGLLDFQDAMTAHPAYDLVSLLQDARRSVPARLQSQMTARYTDATGKDEDAFAAAMACLGAQRNLRILGVFARLCLRDGKPGYLRYQPRVWAYLQRDLAHPALEALAQEVARLLPAPTQTRLNRIATRCPTNPAP